MWRVGRQRVRPCHLVDGYQPNRSSGLSQGELFQIAARAAALAAVLINSNYDIGALGPIAGRYEPLGYPEKTLTAVFETVTASTALPGFLMATGAARTR